MAYTTGDILNYINWINGQNIQFTYTTTSGTKFFPVASTPTKKPKLTLKQWIDQLNEESRQRMLNGGSPQT